MIKIRVQLTFTACSWPVTSMSGISWYHEDRLRASVNSRLMGFKIILWATIVSSSEMIALEMIIIYELFPIQVKNKEKKKHIHGELQWRKGHSHGVNYSNIPTDPSLDDVEIVVNLQVTKASNECALWPAIDWNDHQRRLDGHVQFDTRTVLVIHLYLNEE